MSLKTIPVMTFDVRSDKYSSVELIFPSIVIVLLVFMVDNASVTNFSNTGFFGEYKTVQLSFKTSFCRLGLKNESLMFFHFKDSGTHSK